jgi:hypothetical protein
MYTNTTYPAILLKPTSKYQNLPLLFSFDIII